MTVRHTIALALCAMIFLPVERTFAQETEEASPRIVKAELRWREMGGPSHVRVMRIPIETQEKLCMLSRAIESIRQWDDRWFGLPEGREILGELLISTENDRFRILVSQFGYYFDVGFPQFSQHFCSIGLTNAIEAVLRSEIEDGAMSEAFRGAYWDRARPALDGSGVFDAELEARNRTVRSCGIDTDDSKEASSDEETTDSSDGR